jgi:SAM-dependent methyltransferase
MEKTDLIPTYTTEELLAWKEATRHLQRSGEQYYLEVPGNPFSAPDQSHLNRYVMAREEIEKIRAAQGPGFEEKVLDAAMGCGYGGLLMQPKKYFGIEIQPYVLEYATRFAKPWMGGESVYIQHNLALEDYEYDLEGSKITYPGGKPLPFPNNFFDLVTSFETIEHVSRPSGGWLISEVNRVLKPGGIWFVSSPLDGAKHELVSKFHVHEYEYTELHYALLRNKPPFRVSNIFEQTIQEPTLVPKDILHKPRETSDQEKIFYVVFRCEKL